MIHAACSIVPQQSTPTRAALRSDVPSTNYLATLSRGKLVFLKFRMRHLVNSRFISVD
jgi:hypothetical protein